MTIIKHHKIWQLIVEKTYSMAGITKISLLLPAMVVATVGFAKFQRTNPNLKIQNMEHSLRHHEARLSYLVSCMPKKCDDIESLPRLLRFNRSSALYI